jgi:MYXO-CTERM domain-containing protein
MSCPRFAVVAALLVLSLHASGARAQAPEERGPLTTGSWDAGSISLDGTSIRVRAYFPESGGPYPLVGVIHGANANGTYHTELATTLASHGFVALTPDMPCTVTSCDHDANQRQISAMIVWAVAQSADASSRLAGKVDGSRVGLIGHSWGGLSSHITAARDPSIDSVVLLDPNDDRTDGLSVTSAIVAPHLTLLAQVPGACNSQWQEAMVRTRLTNSHLDFVIARSGHCDPGEMDGLCSFGCGRGDTATTPIFRRYAVAWTSCVLTGDPAMSAWIGGASYDADVTADRLRSVMPSGLETMPCNAGGLPDAGVIAGPDAAVIGELDAGMSSMADAAMDPALDAFIAPGMDAGTSVGRDAGRSVGASTSGCSCRAGEHAPRTSTFWLALTLLVLAARRRRRT